MYSKEEAFAKVSELVERFSLQIDSYKRNDYNETQTRQDFINPFFKALGWDILVQNDEIISDKICIRPTIEFPFCIMLPWKLVSKDFTEYGFLKLTMNTKLKEKNSQVTYSSYFADETILQNYTGNSNDDN